MASNIGRGASNPSNHRPVLRNKPTNQKASAAAVTRKKLPKMAEMSPEARRAMLLIREEDVKENFTADRGGERDMMGEEKNNNNNGGRNINASVKRNETMEQGNLNRERQLRDSKSLSAIVLSKPVGLRPRQLSKGRQPTNFSPSRGATTQATARSRSTLSRGEPPFSVSDNTDSCYHFDSANAPTTSSIYNYNDDRNNGNVNANHAPAEADRLMDEAEASEDSGDESKTENPKSFVVALNRALEQNCVSRLRGDITDGAGISEPGTVRALDGGRLTNAQEVVVNVCHNDDKELVFHDDDEETLDAAKTISQIRVNIWMEYNEEFQPEDVTEDLDFSDHLDLDKDSKSAPAPKHRPLPPSRAQTSGNVNSAVAGARGREATSLGLSRKNTVAKLDASSRSSSTARRDSNNNRSSTARPKSAVSTLQVTHGKQRVGSGVSNEGSRNSGASSGKRETGSKTKRTKH